MSKWDGEPKKFPNLFTNNIHNSFYFKLNIVWAVKGKRKPLKEYKLPVKLFQIQVTAPQTKVNKQF